ncbi:LAFE_0G13608g1_1 [Lachancea fermentati]|uniref:LAFE_0G13608g1_1 n=1 Tax=Lachancea fermentati TaxID=4955 RepID=A0A1G4MI79_LACFM|nr:LAFE_0G13608g1_1 [Lachancea fermentati]
MSYNQKKKLMPKSALLVKKYQRPIRAAFLSLVAALCLLFILRGPANSGDSNIAATGTGKRIMPHADIVQKVHYPKDDGKKENAAFVTLARNKDLWDLVPSIRHIEDRFNRKYHYDWVFLNDEPFDEEFKRVTSALVSGTTKYGLIPEEHWSIPEWINKEKFDQAREKMRSENVIYGDAISYRHMCRYESGFFWRHKLLDDYEWYWRVEPEIQIFCDIDYDVFKFMRENGKKYGFILSLSEYQNTIPTLWDKTKTFMEKYPKHIHKNNLMDFISDDGGRNYNMCHFWSNFEVGSLDFWRSEAYRDYFEYLDKSGGFFYERWGDAPVHSIAAALFLDKDELHFFDGIGYYHPAFTSCPVEESIRVQNKCACDVEKDQTWYTYYFCTRKYFKAKNLSLPPGVEPSP